MDSGRGTRRRSAERKGLLRCRFTFHALLWQFCSRLWAATASLIGRSSLSVRRQGTRKGEEGELGWRAVHKAGERSRSSVAVGVAAAVVESLSRTICVQASERMQRKGEEAEGAHRWSVVDAQQASVVLWNAPSRVPWRSELWLAHEACLPGKRVGSVKWWL